MTLLTKTVLIAATTLVAISGAEAKKNNFRSSPYVGVEMGWLYESHKYTDLRSGSAFTSPQRIQRSHKDTNSFLPGVFLGYRQFFNCYFVGLELSSYVNSSKTTSRAFSDALTPGVTKYNFKGKYNIVSAFTFGRSFRDLFGIYGKVACNFGEYNYRIKEVNSATNVTTNSRRKHKDVAFLLLGGGFEYALNRLWAARLEYNYSFIQGKKIISMYAANSSNGINDYAGRARISCTSALKIAVLAKF